MVYLYQDLQSRDWIFVDAIQYSQLRFQLDFYDDDPPYRVARCELPS